MSLYPGDIAAIFAFPVSSVIHTVGKAPGVEVRRGSGEDAFFFDCGMQIDLDGAPKAYHPATRGAPHGVPPGLDDLRNAGSQGHWWGIAVDPSTGNPYIQLSTDPAPGFYVSTTALEDRSKRSSDPARYVDATAIPYVSLPREVARFCSLGDLAAVYNRATNNTAYAVVADIGPAGKIGEGSLALAQALGNTGRGKWPTQASHVTYVVFPRTHTTIGFPSGAPSIATAAAPLFASWGGAGRVLAEYPT